MQGSWEGKLGNVAVMRKSKRTSLLGASGSASLALIAPKKIECAVVCSTTAMATHQ